MSSNEIKERIDANNSEIESIMTSNLFVLNERVRDLIDENYSLQEQCQHHYENGKCIYCYKEEN